LAPPRLYKNFQPKILIDFKQIADKNEVNVIDTMIVTVISDEKTFLKNLPLKDTFLLSRCSTTSLKKSLLYYKYN
jgi:hypothetical protein